MTFTHYAPLGRSGLVVSPITLGTMTFGTQRWGATEQQSEAIFNAYTEAGGNFIDTANVYSGGESEAMIGRFVKKRHLRDRLVLASKSGFSENPAEIYAGGNSRKAIYQSLERSLERLQTDYLDMYWVHIWDGITPAEELLQTLSTLVQTGKIRYYGFSNTPVWYLSQLITLARLHGLPEPVALQYEYSLIQRAVEHEYVPLARNFGLSVLPWSPLGGGFLTGKYKQEEVENREPLAMGLPGGAMDNDAEHESDGRLNGPNPFGDSKFTAKNWLILESVQEIAQQLDASPAQVALAWLNHQPSVASVIAGASSARQLAQNMASTELVLSAEQLQSLNALSEPEISAVNFFIPAMQAFIFGHHLLKK